MRIIKYETPKDELHKYHSVFPGNGPVVFLAGPTVRGNQPHLTSWRREAEEEFKRQGFNGTLIVPEFSDPKESDQHRYYIPEWEFEGLKLADVIMFWICRTRELIGLTTNFEFGYWMAMQRQKVVYGRPNDAYRIKYDDIMWEADAAVPWRSCSFDKTIYTTLPNTVEAAIKLTEEKTR